MGSCVRYMQKCSMALLRINMAENWNCPTNFDGSFQCHILIKSVERFMGYMEIPFMVYR
jgi:hypothetical protein